MYALLLILIIAAAVIFGPLALIWSLNTLFLLNIPYTLTTWAAALVLGAAVAPKMSSSKE